MRHPDFTGRMAEGKAIAAARRNRGLAVGSHASWAHKPGSYDPTICPFAVIRAHYRSRFAEVRASVQFAVFGDQWTGL